MKRLALSINLDRCIGCKSCEAACKQANNLGPHEYRNRVMWLQGEIPKLDFLTHTCQQCERPACVRACPVNPKALEIDPQSGVIEVHESRCTGCGECAIACPYGAMGYDPVGQHAVKCNLCSPRRALDLDPACATVCPTNAINFGERTSLLTNAEATGATVLEHDHFLQKPATLYVQQKPSQLQQTKVPELLADHSARSGLVRAQQTMQTADRIIAGGCHICFNSCPVKFHLSGDRVVNVFGNEDDPIFKGKVCAKSQMTVQLYDNKQRLTFPQKRIGTRGEGKFERISWSQALDEIAARLIKLRDEYGPETLAIHAGTRTGVLNIIGIMPMFARLWGTPNTATTEHFCDAAKVVALQLTQGSTNLANIYTEDDMGSAELYLYIGDNQAETRPVNFAMINDWRMQNNATMVVVDPRQTVTAAKADQWLAIRPGTDMALGLALIHEIFNNETHDQAFCEQHVQGWQAWREHIQHRDFSPQWAASITDIAADSIIKLAAQITAANGTMIYLSRGINQHTNATQTNRVFMFLAAITGNWGRKGGGWFNVSAEPDWQAIPIDDALLPEAGRPGISKNPAAWVSAMLGSGAYPLRALITGNNPAAQWPEQSQVRKAFTELDLLVHVECFANATSKFADYLLPMATGIEKGGCSRLAEDRRIVWNDALIPPPGEARSDHWFWIELGKRLGYQSALKEEYKDPGQFWQLAFSQATPDLRGATLDRLRSAPGKWLRTPIYQPGDAQAGTLYLDTANPGKRFPTTSGKLEFHTTEQATAFAEVGLTSLPEFYAESGQLRDMAVATGTGEMLLSPFFAKPVYTEKVQLKLDTNGAALRQRGYDTELITGRPSAAHFHSWTHYNWQAQEMWPQFYCQLHPNKAADIGVIDGDWVKIESSVGEVKARAWVTAGIRETAVFIPIGWDETQPDNPAKPANTLTRLMLDPVSQQANLKAQLCRVSKA